MYSSFTASAPQLSDARFIQKRNKQRILCSEVVCSTMSGLAMSSFAKQQTKLLEKRPKNLYNDGKSIFFKMFYNIFF